jgi:hypothetical protein
MARVIQCLGRRRIVVQTDGKNTILVIWLGDPPKGKKIAGLELDPLERDKLLLELTEAIANAGE